MKKSQFHWVVKDTETTQEVENWLKQNNLSKELADLLVKRNIVNEEQLQTFFFPTIENLHDPYMLYDMEKAIERLQEAISMGQKIMIYGDYDADGITSTTVLKEAIELVGGDVSYFLPNRFKHGYGPNVDVYKEMIENGTELIVTVDNGVTGHEAVDYANSQGVDVIITDHHEIPDTLPDAYAIVHPRHPKGDYPFGDLAGVGVAFKVATALLDEVPMELLDLVAIGTIADLVSLTDENRVLVKLGLETMKNSDRVGLHALCKVAGIELSDITSENIGFGLGPRLNAIGRLDDATPGVTLLSSFDLEEVTALANEIQQMNEQRQKIVGTIFEEAMSMVQTMGDQNIYLLAKEGWHEGVLGIVASHVVQETNRPTIILGIDTETGIAKGSGRSIEAINLYDLLQNVKDKLAKFGGHHMAAGMSIPVANIGIIQETLNQTIENMEIDFSVGSPLEVEDNFTIKQLSVPFIEQLDKLGPFGTDNAAPTFLFKEVKALNVRRIGADQKHLKCVLSDGEQDLDMIAFGFGKSSGDFETGEHIDVVGTLGINEWNGNRKAQMMLKDYQIEGQQIFDYREQLHRIKELATLEDATYVVFNQKNISYFKEIDQNKIVHYHHLSGSVTNLVVLDCPDTVESFQQVWREASPEKTYLVLYSEEQCYLNGMPSRDQFKKLFGFIQQQDSLDVRYKTGMIAQFLKIPEKMIIFMIQVFFDLEFVTIEDGVMSKKEGTVFRPLEESSIYKSRLKKIDVERLLLYSNIKELEEHVFQ